MGDGQLVAVHAFYNSVVSSWQSMSPRAWARGMELPPPRVHRHGGGEVSSVMRALTLFDGGDVLSRTTSSLAISSDSLLLALWSVSKAGLVCEVRHLCSSSCSRSGRCPSLFHFRAAVCTVCCVYLCCVGWAIVCKDVINLAPGLSNVSLIKKKVHGVTVAHSQTFSAHRTRNVHICNMTLLHCCPPSKIMGTQ